MRVFLNAPKRFENVCSIARTLEVLGVRECYVFDQYRLIRPRYGRSRARQVNGTSAGAFRRVAFTCVDDASAFLAAAEGRVVATVAAPGAQPLTAFSFQRSDTLVFGSEARGLEPELLAHADQRVTIPQRGVTESLNLAVAVGIVLFEALRQLEQP